MSICHIAGVQRGHTATRRWRESNKGLEHATYTAKIWTLRQNNQTTTLDNVGLEPEGQRYQTTLSGGTLFHVFFDQIHPTPRTFEKNDVKTQTM